jgi:hypothetical protein
MVPRSLLAALICAAATTLVPSPAHADVTWLCHPALKSDPCRPGLATTRFSAAGEKLGVERPRQHKRRIDCFYVYPTVSDQQRDIATKRKDPEILSIARFQAARYSQECRVFAPVYRQRTIVGLVRSPELVNERGYRDVREAWRTYLHRHNRGRGVVIMGHSQGTWVLRKLIAEEVDRKPRVRRRLVSALLLGGNAATRDFRNIDPCRSARQLGCMIAFSTYDEAPPEDGIFARAERGDAEPVCTNPANLGSREAAGVEPIFPGVRFAPGTAIGNAIDLMGVEQPLTDTPWAKVEDAYRARCVKSGGFDYLELTPIDGAPDFKPSPTPQWGLHLTDGNIALGDLIRVVRAQAAAYARR